MISRRTAKIMGLIIFLVLSPLAGLADQNIAPGLWFIDPHTLVGVKNFITDYKPRTLDGFTQVIIEIPAGTNAKWEVLEPDGILRWEEKNGKPRVVRYLGYPGNYGMVPGTLGGDGDPIDAIVLGPVLLRGSVVKVKIIGVLKLIDTGDRDDKLIAVLPSGIFGKVNSLIGLEQKFPGVRTIVETWFQNYKGPRRIESQGYSDIMEAKKLLTKAIRAYAHQWKKE